MDKGRRPARTPMAAGLRQAQQRISVVTSGAHAWCTSAASDQLGAWCQRRCGNAACPTPSRLSAACSTKTLRAWSSRCRATPSIKIYRPVVWRASRRAASRTGSTRRSSRPHHQEQGGQGERRDAASSATSLREIRRDLRAAREVAQRRHALRRLQPRSHRVPLAYVGGGTQGAH